jgi:hypothetical protein
MTQRVMASGGGGGQDYGGRFGAIIMQVKSQYGVGGPSARPEGLLPAHTIAVEAFPRSSVGRAPGC